VDASSLKGTTGIEESVDASSLKGTTGIEESVDASSLIGTTGFGESVDSSLAKRMFNKIEDASIDEEKVVDVTP